MKTIKLSNRLSAIADFISKGSRVCDVGTDHGHLPIWLAQEGACERIIASDLRQGPLESARRNAARQGMEGRIDFLLTDGLSGINPDSVDTIVMAGMGGETIASILAKSGWAMERGYTLILQPMSKTDELRSFIYGSGYKTTDERLVKERGDIYVVIKAQKGEAGAITSAGLYVGNKLFENCDSLLGEYLDMLISKAERAIEGLEKSESEKAGEKLVYLQELLGEFMQMRKEV